MVRRKYTDEFKKEAVKLVTQEGYTQSEASKRLGIDSKNISRWIAALSDESNQTKDKIGLTTEQEELYKLRKEVKKLLMEREILKKAAAFFANQEN